MFSYGRHRNGAREKATERNVLASFNITHGESKNDRAGKKTRFSNWRQNAGESNFVDALNCRLSHSRAGLMTYPPPQVVLTNPSMPQSCDTSLEPMKPQRVQVSDFGGLMMLSLVRHFQAFLIRINLLHKISGLEPWRAFVLALGVGLGL